MIDVVAIKSTAQALLVRLSKLPPAQVRWKDEAEGATWTGDPSLWLSLASLREYGYLEERRVQPDATDDASVEAVQQKGFTLSIAAESFSQKFDDVTPDYPRHAGVLLDVLKTRLKRSTTLYSRDGQAPQLAGVFAIGAYHPTKYVPYKDQSGRTVNRYVMDLDCLSVDSEIDDTLGAGGWIGEIVNHGTINNAVGPNPAIVDLDVKGS